MVQIILLKLLLFFFWVWYYNYLILVHCESVTYIRLMPRTQRCRAWCKSKKLQAARMALFRFRRWTWCMQLLHLPHTHIYICIYLYKPVQIWALHLPLCCGSLHQGILLHVERLRNRFWILLQCCVAGDSEQEMNFVWALVQVPFRMMHSMGGKRTTVCTVVQSLVAWFLGLLQLFPKIFHRVWSSIPAANSAIGQSLQLQERPVEWQCVDRVSREATATGNAAFAARSWCCVVPTLTELFYLHESLRYSTF